MLLTPFTVASVPLVKQLPEDEPAPRYAAFAAWLRATYGAKGWNQKRAAQRFGTYYLDIEGDTWDITIENYQ